MTNRENLLSVILTWSVIATLAAAKDDDRFVAKGEEAGRLADLVERTTSLGFSGAVLAARDGEVLVAAGVGSADADGEVPNTANTLFEIASATKQFTAAAICELVERKKLRLDDPIAEHLPGIPDDCATITVRHLLMHTSGIPGTNSRGGGTDLAAVLPSFLAGGPQHEPGTHWEYWNQGYALLSEIVARASRSSYVEFSRKQLFEKAGMKSTRFTGDPPPKGAVVATGLSKNGDRGALEHPYGAYGFQYRGMGGAVSNVWDLWRWDRALHARKILGDAMKAELFEPGPNDYALGWYVRERGGRTVQSHGGGVRGFTCEIRRYPDQDGCLFVLSNRDDVSIHPVADLLERALFGEPVTTPPAALTDALREAVLGAYVSSRGVRLVIEADGAVTRALIEWHQREDGGPFTRAVLGAEGKDGLLLYEGTDSTPIQVERDRAGAVERLRLGPQEFERESG